MPEIIHNLVPAWLWKSLLTSLAFFSLSLICLVLFIVIHRFLRVKNTQEHNLLLANLGNVRSIYQIRVTSPEPALKFRLLLQQIPLVEVFEPEPVSAPEPPAAAAGKPEQKTARTGLQSPVGQGPAGQGPVKKAGKAVSAKTGMAASFLGVLGSLLPGGAGKQLKETGTAVRGVQTKANQAAQAQDRVERKVEAVQKVSSKAGVQAGGARPVVRTQAANADAQHPSEMTVTAAQPLREAKVVRKGSGQRAYCAQTGEVGPGESLSLTLRIESKKNRWPEGTFPYLVSSQQIPVEKIDREAAPATRPGMVYFSPVPAWRYWLPRLTRLVVAAVTLAGFGMCLLLIW